MLQLVRFIAAFTMLFSGMVWADVYKTEQVEVELVSEVSSIEAGQPFWVALRMKMAPHWHVYWENPGDAGLPPSITWELPEGFAVSDIQWPYPKRVKFDEFVNYGYEDEILLPMLVTPPAELTTGLDVTLKGEADWLVCHDVCIPQAGEVSLDLPVEAQSQINEGYAGAFSEARSKLPIQNSEWQVEAAEIGEQLIIQATAPAWFEGSQSQVMFYPTVPDYINNGADQAMVLSGNTLQLTVQLMEDRFEEPDTISGILVSETGWRGEGSERAMYFQTVIQSDIAAIGTETEAAGLNQILIALGLAFLGGMILNLMPCVLPVLSIKILGFVQQAGEEGPRVFQHGLVFMLGVLVSFWILAGALLLLRAGGEQFGWGFQLQSPTFVIILCVFLFVFGLSLFGLFEIGTSLMSVGQSASTKSGFFGSFMSGVTATVVATPCTAPFMGSALGFALGQPALISMMIFTSLGLGMAFPYVLLASSPALLKFVPKPGPWMESLKEFMGFLLMATVVWLLWVLGGQVGATGMSFVLISLVIVGIGGWIFGRWGNISKARPVRFTAQVIAILLVLASTAFAIDNATMAETDSDGLEWAEFSPELISDLRSQGTPVFIDFTAKWCLSCQVNKKVAFGSEEVQEEFESRGIVAVQADWTNYDEQITQALAEFGRNSVPLYVLYGTDPNQEPMILPEVLSPGIVLDALEELE